MIESQGSNVRGCLHCGLVQRVPGVPVGHEAHCACCGGTVLRSGGSNDNRRCAALALSALICYPPGIALPEVLGRVKGDEAKASALPKGGRQTGQD